MSAAIRLEVAQEKIAEMANERLIELAEEFALWTLADRVGVQFQKLELIVLRERLRRGLVTMHDLLPHQRRKMVDPQDIDLHAIASGPIMDAAEIYLPAGKLSMADTRAREAAQVSKA